MRRTLLFAVGLVIVFGLSACGSDDTADNGRRIDVEMADNVFSPGTIEVEAGETVTFVFTKEGEAVHEAFVGTAEEQDERAIDMEAGHDGHGSGVRDAELIGPEDPAAGFDPGEVTGLLRAVYAAAVGGAQEGWADLDEVMAAEGHTAVLVSPRRVYSNPGS